VHRAPGDILIVSREKLASLIDHTLLAPAADRGAVKKLCSEAQAYYIGHVCVNPHYVAGCRDLLRGTGVGICSVVGFPLGAALSEVKALEARRAVEHGADEVDMVQNIGALRSGEDFLVREDIEAVVKASGVTTKVILETALLSEDEKRRGCLAALEAGAHFVKTSTGFAQGGATVADVRLMKGVVGERLGVKASGGIRTYDAALSFLEAGATRIGTSSGPAILDGWRQ
jgi:deoxyribose-phosphate aldolase